MILNIEPINDVVLADRRNLYSTPIANWSMGNTFTIANDDFSDFVRNEDIDLDSLETDNDFSGFPSNSVHGGETTGIEFSGFRESMLEIEPPTELRKILDDMKSIVDESKRAIDRSKRLLNRVDTTNDLSTVDTVDGSGLSNLSTEVNTSILGEAADTVGELPRFDYFVSIYKNLRSRTVFL